MSHGSASGREESHFALKFGDQSDVDKQVEIQFENNF